MLNIPSPGLNRTIEYCIMAGGPRLARRLLLTCYTRRLTGCGIPSSVRFLRRLPGGAANGVLEETLGGRILRAG